MVYVALNIQRFHFLDFSVAFTREHLALIVGENVLSYKNWEARHVVIRPIGALRTSLWKGFYVIVLSNILNILLLVIGLINFWNIGWTHNFIISGFRALVSLVVRFLTFQIIIKSESLLFLDHFATLIFGLRLRNFGLGKLHLDLIAIWFVVNIIQIVIATVLTYL